MITTPHCLEKYEYTPSDTWLGLAEVYKKTEEPEKLVVALENGSRGKLTQTNSGNALRLAQSKIELGDVAGAKRVLDQVVTSSETEELQRLVLLGQSSLLSKSATTPPSSFEGCANKIQNKLSDVEVASLEPRLLALSHEIMIRCWLAADKLEKAEEGLRTAAPLLSGNPAFLELNKQLQIQKTS